MGKRHYKGAKSSENKKARMEAEAKWKSVRGDETKNQFILPTENKRFNLFYKAQGFVEEGEDWNRYLEHLRLPLPACFRFNPDYPFTPALKAQLHSFVGETVIVDGKEIPAVVPLLWYPSECGYKLGTDRRSIRKLTAFENLHKFLILHSDNGNLTRQEAVSMVPPLALKVSPHHRCLDMCAAPGSKTTQLLEIVQRSLSGPEDKQGLVIANDADTDRAYMLTHQCRRLNSPLLIISTHKGQMFPPIRGVGSEGGGGSGYFDRVLCDVPCSGDGTLRKNPAIWSKWALSGQLGLHPLQLSIAQRGLQLLRPGGRRPSTTTVASSSSSSSSSSDNSPKEKEGEEEGEEEEERLLVYSTCSMSPYEDEAVVAELLRTNRGTLELLDPRDWIPNFRARPGLTDWFVLDDSGAMKKEIQDRRKAKKDEKIEMKRKDKTEEGGEGDEGDEEGERGEEEEKKEMETQEKGEGEKEAQNDDQQTETTTEPTEPSSSSSSSSSSESSLPSSQPHPNPHVQECLDNGFSLYSSYDDIPKSLQYKFRRSLFPPTEEEIGWMHLERCMRCVPQDEDTGGFFVATFRKLRPPSKNKSPSSSSPSSSSPSSFESPSSPNSTSEEETVQVKEEKGGEGDEVVVADNEESSSSPTSSPSSSSSSSSSGLLISAHKSPVDFRPWDPLSFAQLHSFYQMSSTLTSDPFYVRDDASMNPTSSHSKGKGSSSSSTVSVQPPKSVYFLPKPVRDVLQGDPEGRLKIVTAGLKVLERKALGKGKEDGEYTGDAVKDYRFLQDGMQILSPYLQQRQVSVSAQDFCNLMGGGLVSFSTLSSSAVQSLLAVPVGALVCVYSYDPKDVLPTETVDSSTKEEQKEKEMDVASASSPSNDYHSHKFYALCSRHSDRTINVMCGKLEIQTMVHQLTALNVMRPKIIAVRGIGAASNAVQEATSASTEIVEEGEREGEEENSSSTTNLD